MSKKAIFLDRDDTLIEDPGYISSPGQVKLLGGVPQALIEFRNMGYKLVVVSNQSGVARGIVTEKAIGKIHDRLKQLLSEGGAYLDGIYYCPYHPEGVIQKYRKESDDRKPNPGMLLKAAEQMDIDLGESWTIGNSARDIDAGLRAGCKTILLDLPAHTKSYEPDQPKPDYKAVNMKEAVNIIKKYHRTSVEQQDDIATTEIQETPLPAQVEAPVGLQRKEIAETELSTSSEKSEQLLSNILEQLKTMQRDDMFEEFSMMRVLAGILQGAVLLCLLIGVWLLMHPDRSDNSVLFALGFAAVFQLMALTFYIMRDRK